LKFSNGDPVTAQDFKWSFERAAHPDTASTVAEEFLGDIVGIQDIVDGNASSASGIEVVDERTLRLTIDAPKDLPNGIRSEQEQRRITWTQLVR